MLLAALFPALSFRNGGVSHSTTPAGVAFPQLSGGVFQFFLVRRLDRFFLRHFATPLTGRLGRNGSSTITTNVNAAPDYPVRPPRRWGLVRQRLFAFELPLRTSFSGPPHSAGFSSLASGPRNSCLIGEATSYDTREKAVCAILVIATQCDPVAVSELELRQIAVKVLLGAMLINALHAALEDAEIAFNGVGVDASTDVLASLVVHAAMAKVIVTELVAICLGFVGQDVGFAINVRLHNRDNLVSGGAIDHERTALAALTVNESENR